MITGGVLTLTLMIWDPMNNPDSPHLHYSIYGIGASAVVFVVLSLLWPDSDTVIEKAPAQSADQPPEEN